MSLFDAIGGYFELELGRGGTMLHGDALLLNSGRACFAYILNAQKPTKVYLPKYTCDVMLEPLQALGVPYEFYGVNDDLELAQEISPQDGELFVYNNYFGVKDEYCQSLAIKYKDGLILDCAQAYYFAPPQGPHTFYSPRKFFGVPDGGCLYTTKRLDRALPESTSLHRTTHLLKRIDQGAAAGYDDFQKAEATLTNEPMQQMSSLTKRLLESIDFEAAKQARQRNFAFLHERLKSQNHLNLSPDSFACAMVYPYRTNDPTLRQKLIDQRIFVATYWPNVLTWSQEGEAERRLASEIIPLPIDQRYTEADMQRILDALA